MPQAITSSRTGDRFILRVNLTWWVNVGLGVVAENLADALAVVGDVIRHAEAVEDGNLTDGVFKFILSTPCSFDEDISIPLSRSLPELLELVSSDIPEEEQSEMILPRSQRARNLLGVFRNERTVTVKSASLLLKRCASFVFAGFDAIADGITSGVVSSDDVTSSLMTGASR